MTYSDGVNSFTLCLVDLLQVYIYVKPSIHFVL